MIGYDDGLREDAERTYKRLCDVKRVKYSSCGDRGIEAGVYDAGDLIDLHVSGDGDMVHAKVRFDECECWMDARLLHVGGE